MISIQKQELMQWKVTCTENRLKYTEKKEQTAMAIVYLTLQNHIFSNTKNVIDQIRNRHSKSVKLIEISRVSPYRNQIDYICIKDSPNITIYNSRHTADCV